MPTSLFCKTSRCLPVLPLSGSFFKKKKKSQEKISETSQNNHPLCLAWKKRHTFSRRAQIYSWRVGVNIYLENEEKSIIFMSSLRVWSDYRAVQCERCMLDLLLPPKCLGRKRCIILVTHAVSSQFVFGHKWKIQVSLVCHWRRLGRTHTYARPRARAHTPTYIWSEWSFTVNIHPATGNHLMLWS